LIAFPYLLSGYEFLILEPILKVAEEKIVLGAVEISILSQGEMGLSPSGADF
jgi:hypothetical protein